jgi:ATP-dependent DNA helicase RecG
MKRKGVFCELSALKKVIPQVGKLLEALQGEMSRGELMEKLRLKDRMHFRMDYLQPALTEALSK